MASFLLPDVASRTLKAAGMREQAGEMCRKVSASGNYNEALNIIGEYVNFGEAGQQEQSKNETEEFGMKME